MVRAVRARHADTAAASVSGGGDIYANAPVIVQQRVLTVYSASLAREIIMPSVILLGPSQGLGESQTQKRSVPLPPPFC